MVLPRLPVSCRGWFLVAVGVGGIALSPSLFSSLQTEVSKFPATLSRFVDDPEVFNFTVSFPFHSSASELLPSIGIEFDRNGSSARRSISFLDWSASQEENRFVIRKSEEVLHSHLDIPLGYRVLGLNQSRERDGRPIRGYYTSDGLCEGPEESLNYDLEDLESESLVVQQDWELGFQQLGSPQRYSSSHTIVFPSRALVMPPNRPFLLRLGLDIDSFIGQPTIHLLTHLTPSRIPRLSRLLSHWSGETVVAVIYLPDLKALESLERHYLRAVEEDFERGGKGSVNPFRDPRVTFVIVKPRWIDIPCKNILSPPTTKCKEDGESTGDWKIQYRYPINQLRNLALHLSASMTPSLETTWAFMLDVDFVPFPSNLHDRIVMVLKRDKRFWINGTGVTKGSSGIALIATALAVPAFELPDNRTPLQSLDILTRKVGTVGNEDKRNDLGNVVEQMIERGDLKLTDPNGGHGPIMAGMFDPPVWISGELKRWTRNVLSSLRARLVWKETPASSTLISWIAFLVSFLEDEENSRWKHFLNSATFSLPITPQVEPYLLLPLPSHPYYPLPSHFTDQGGDKQAHWAIWNGLLGGSTRVLRVGGSSGGGVVHFPKHTIVMGEEGEGEKWPLDEVMARSGIRQPSNPHHFSSAQSESENSDDQTRNTAQEEEGVIIDWHTRPVRRIQTPGFNYFSHFLPLLSFHGGINFRWPKGSEAERVGVGGVLGEWGRWGMGSVAGI